MVSVFLIISINSFLRYLVIIYHVRNQITFEVTTVTNFKRDIEKKDIEI